ATTILGCNAILGIEEAKLNLDASAPAAGGGGGSPTSTSGTGGSAAGAGGGGGSTCSLTAPDSCNNCIASRCCDKYEACSLDADCMNALAQYNVCVGVDFTNDAGGTCDETFGASTNANRSDLAKCAFQRGSASTPPGCTEACFGKPVGGSICSDYCACAA